MDRLAKGLRAEFARQYPDASAPRLALAPGRVNLIGEHTDYNEGFVLPMAINRYVAVAFAVRNDTTVEVSAPDLRGRGTFDLEELEPGSASGWMGYVAGVFWALRRSGFRLCGMDLLIQGEVPIGAGLSSSAALELAVARAACAASELVWDPLRMATLAQTAERDYVGVSCGIMDHLAAALSANGCALLLDCRSLETRRIPLPASLAVVVMDTGVRRRLGTSAYNQRVQECYEALAIIRRAYPEVLALRDVTREMLAALSDRMSPVVFRRAVHVVEETARPARLAAALRATDHEEAGRLISKSHRSLRDLFEVSCPELDAMVELAVQHSACYGARLTGAGFGGCAIAAVKRSEVESFVTTVSTAYRARCGHEPTLFACNAAQGAFVIAPL